MCLCTSREESLGGKWCKENAPTVSKQMGSVHGERQAPGMWLVWGSDSRYFATLLGGRQALG